MLTPTLTTVRLFLHVLGATVWVGGQLTVAGLVPGLRQLDERAPRFVGRRFSVIAWSAFALLVLTGVWNVLAVDVADTGIAYQATLMAKLTVVAVAGIAAFLHGIARSPRGLAIWGAVGVLASVTALFLGVLLAQG